VTEYELIASGVELVIEPGAKLMAEVEVEVPDNNELCTEQESEVELENVEIWSSC
jgi:hypothetical protein